MIEEEKITSLLKELDDTDTVYVQFGLKRSEWYYLFRSARSWLKYSGNFDEAVENKTELLRLLKDIAPSWLPEGIRQRRRELIGRCEGTSK